MPIHTVSCIILLAHDHLYLATEHFSPRMPLQPFLLTFAEPVLLHPVGPDAYLLHSMVPQAHLLDA